MDLIKDFLPLLATMDFFIVAAITNSTLNSTLTIPLNTYSLQNALNINSVDAYGPIALAPDAIGYTTSYLFDTGCKVDGVPNCTAACQDAGSAFSTLDTLHNCMMYPVIADQYSKGNLSKEIAQLAYSLGIEKEQWPSSSISLNITKTIGSCLDAYCVALPDCNYSVHYQDTPGYYNPFTFLDRTGPFYFDLSTEQDNWDGDGLDFDLCAYVNVSANQDIGGIGVRSLEH